jgi:hypothetical protein
MKKAITPFALLIIFSLNVFSQAPAWLWAKSAGGTSHEFGNSVAVDVLGNVYVTGTFDSPTVTFGSTTLTCVGWQDIFIVKYDEAGNVLWAKGAGGPNIDYSLSIATDLNGNAYITGSFHMSTITFDTITLTTAGVQDIFIAKYDAAGNVLWAKRAGGTNFDEGTNITTDNDNVYLTGDFSSSSINFGSTALTNSGGTDIFLAKYDSSGNVIWAKSAGGIYQDKPSGIKTDVAGSVFLSGFFSSTSISFGSSILTNADASGGTYDIFLVKYDSSGNLLWVRREGGNSDDGADAIAIDTSANIFITGSFSSPTITFGSATLMLGSTWGDIFTAKYDSSGNPLWAKKAGGTYNQAAYGASTDMNGNIYIAGAFQSDTCSFGSIILTNASNTTDEDIFVAKYDGTGNVLWAVSAGGPPQDVPWDICTNALGNVYITGYFWSSTLSFGSNTLINGGPPTTGDMFVAKLDYITDISEQANFHDGLNLFPNPATNELRIQNTEFKIDKVEIYDVIGQRVFNQQLNANNQQLTLNVSFLQNGIYFLRLKSNSKTRTQKFIISR